MPIDALIHPDELSAHDIALIRSCLRDGTYTPLEQSDFGKLCDQALTAIDLRAEVAELRAAKETAERALADMQTELSVRLSVCQEGLNKFLKAIP